VVTTGGRAPCAVAPCQVAWDRVGLRAL